MKTDLNRRGMVTKLMHLFLALAVVHQLVVSNYMTRPDDKKPENLAYELHEYVGLASFAVVLLYWIWTVLRRREVRFRELFPWFSPSATGAIWRDFIDHLQSWSRGKMPDVSARPFASAVHGLGLVIITVMGATGALSLLASVPEGVRSLSLGVHEVFAKLVWVFLIGHAGMALLHEFAGHRLFRQMFWTR